MILEKKETNLYEIISTNYQEIDLEYNKEIGYLLSYSNDDVYISVVIYDGKNEQVTYLDKLENFNIKMIKALENHLII